MPSLTAWVAFAVVGWSFAFTLIVVLLHEGTKAREILDQAHGYSKELAKADRRHRSEMVAWKTELAQAWDQVERGVRWEEES